MSDLESISNQIARAVLERAIAVVNTAFDKAAPSSNAPVIKAGTYTAPTDLVVTQVPVKPGRPGRPRGKSNTKAQVVAMSRDGASAREIGQRLNLSVSAVHYHLRTAGIAP